jgi:hypothetical protein
MHVPQLHKSTIIVGLITAALAVLICIPGRTVKWQPYSYATYEHGWPYVFLRRQSRLEPLPYGDPMIIVFHKDGVMSLPNYGIPWLGANNWKVWSVDPRGLLAPRKFHPWHLIADTAAAAAVIAVVTGTWEFRRRRRASPLAFSLGDMLAAVTSVCAILGWIALERRTAERELPVTQRYWGGDDYIFNPWGEACVAPLWTKSLLGERLMPAFTWRINQGNINANLVHNFEELQAEMSVVPHVTHICLQSVPGGNRHFRFSMLRAVPRLETLELREFRSLDDQDIRDLCELPGLKKIVFEKKDDVDPATLDKLQTTLPGCAIVDYYDDW